MVMKPNTMFAAVITQHYQTCAEPLNRCLAPRLSRKVQIFLCRKFPTTSLSVIGDRFCIGDSGVAQSYFRFLN